MKHDKNSSRRKNIYKLISNEIKSEVINDNNTSLIERNGNTEYTNINEDLDIVAEISVDPIKEKYI